MSANINGMCCCDQMQFFLEERRVAIAYNPRCREYYIKHYVSGGIELIDYCPWCGCHFPNSLGKLYCETLLELHCDPFDEDDIPEKYKTDAWWRKRDDLSLTYKTVLKHHISRHPNQQETAESIFHHDITKTHCCEFMQFFLSEKRVAVGYYPRCREYYIRLYTSGGSQLINFCPWCGRKLPKSLRDLYCDTLEKLGYEPFDDNIPEEYKTDAWWCEIKT